MSEIINGKSISEKIIEELKEETSKLDKKPGLAIVLVGNNPASELYVKIKEKRCGEVGFNFKKVLFSDNSEEEEIIKKIEELNSDEEVHGIIVQLPLPAKFNTDRIINSIDPRKDVDGLTGNSFIPATPKGIIKLVESIGIEFHGKVAVVVGTSKIVGQPTSILLKNKGCEVITCDINTINLEEKTRKGDILVVATGNSRLIKKEMVKPGAVVIDVGTNKVDGKLVGDVDFESVKEVAGHITPVPGGVGPMTVSMLLENVLESYKKLNL
tara:strand:+ start:12604 stop:13410 length:807 start_codon:yes stop_codon:yes gene_type:complete